jgi:hypothetical protein
MMSPIYDVSMLSFGLAFMKKGFGGIALPARLASMMSINAPARTVGTFLNNIMKRVLGGRGSEVIARRVCTELSRMVYQRPVCKYMRSLQVMQFR